MPAGPDNDVIFTDMKHALCRTDNDHVNDTLEEMIELFVLDGDHRPAIEEDLYEIAIDAGFLEADATDLVNRVANWQWQG